jgi:hypothetical protein
MRRAFSRFAMLVIGAAVLALTTSIASADGPNWVTVSSDFHGPLFGLNVGKGDELLVAEAGNGAVKLDPDDGTTVLLGSLPGISDVIQVGRREYIAVTGGGEPGDPSQARLFSIKNGNVEEIADIGAFETEVDPADDGVESNPFDLAKLSRNKVLIADAAGNSLLVVDKDGDDLDWVASFPQFQNVPTQPLKDLAGCPAGPPDVCDLPDVIGPPAFPEGIDPVPTSVEVGPDGAIYVGELMGFPPIPGFSRIWRIEPDARHVKCLEENDEDDDCTLVDSGPFTSIIDLKFDEDGTAYVLELDEATWLGAESPAALGGTVNACSTHNGRGENGGGDNERRGNNGRGEDDDDGRDNGNGSVSWSCEEIATGLPFPLAVAVDDESVYVTLALGPEGPVEVAKLTGTGNGGGDEDEDD